MVVLQTGQPSYRELWLDGKSVRTEPLNPGADEQLTDNFPRFTLPLLILHGTADKAAKASGRQHFYEMAGSTDKTLKLYDGAFHDLLNDTGQNEVMGDIERWIDAHLTA